MRRRFLASMLLFGCLPLSAAEAILTPEARQTAVLLREKAFTGTRASEWARSLADEVGPRPAGSDGDRAAVAWAVAFEKIPADKREDETAKKSPKSAPAGSVKN